MTSHFSPSGLLQALGWACERHKAPHTCLFSNPVDVTTCQGIMRKSAIRMEHRLVSKQTGARDVFETVNKHVFDLKKGVTLRLVLCEELPTSYYFILGYHHILMDGFSWGLCLPSCRVTIETAADSRNISPPPVYGPYADWSRKQLSDVLGGLDLAKDRKFRREALSSLPLILPLLPVSRIAGRKPLRAYELNRAKHKSSKGLPSLAATWQPPTRPHLSMCT
ncbi:hypothetical protein MCOR25_011183 [Pyricularia grisea]|nr:hypothetical protein MCOR25_011183 [Pyricularia grisea]